MKMTKNYFPPFFLTKLNFYKHLLTRSLPMTYIYVIGNLAILAGDILSALQLYKSMTYIYVTSKNGKIANDVYIRHRQRTC